MMNSNEELIHKFYSAFQQRDYKTMQECYGDSATFGDPVFQNLNSAQVKAMWEMLCKNAKDFKLEFTNVIANERTGHAEWTAWSKQALGTTGLLLGWTPFVRNKIRRTAMENLEKYMSKK